MNRYKTFILFLLFLTILFPASGIAEICHRLHSCPSEDGSYICGDEGICSRCPDNQFCRGGQPIGKTVELGPGYSLELPPKWNIEKRGSLQHKLVFTRKRDGFEPALSLDVMRAKRTSLKDYVPILMKAVKRSFREFKQKKPVPFSAKNTRGYKVVVTYENHSGKMVRVLHYIFQNSRKEKLVFTCRVALETGTRLDKVFDRMIRTFVTR